MRKLFTFDEEMTNKMRIKNEKSIKFRIAAILSHSGDSWIWCGILFLVWFFSTGTIQRRQLFGESVLWLPQYLFCVEANNRRRRPERRVGKCLSPTGSAFISVRSRCPGRADYRTCLQYVPPANNGFIYTLGSFNDLSRVITGVHYLFDVMQVFFWG